MPRDVNGNYTLPLPPVVPHTIIESDFENDTDLDIADALTDSLSRTGSGGMLVPFKNADGTQANPGITWVNEPTSGWYRAGTQDFWYSVGSQNVFRISSAGIELAPGKTAINISSFIRVQDAEPSPMRSGEEWWESDTGGFYMRYQNPDLTFTWVSLAAAGGDFIPFPMKGAANGVAELGATGVVPDAQLARGVANGVASLDGAGIVPVSQLPPVVPPTPGQLVPPGVILDFGGPLASIPAGYLNCDGSAQNRVTFAALFAAIGINWGPGDGSTTFNLPLLDRRVTVGAGGVGTAVLANTVGAVGGAETHTLLTAEMPAHTHTMGDPNGGGGSGALSLGGVSQSTGSTGGGGAHNNIQPSAVVRKIIKT